MDKSICRHYWLLEPDRMTAIGVCSICREIRLFNPGKKKTEFLGYPIDKQDIKGKARARCETDHTDMPQGVGDNKLEKRVKVIAIEARLVHEVILNNGTSASELLSYIGLPDWQLMTQRGHFFEDDENVYRRIGNSAKLYVFNSGATDRDTIKQVSLRDEVSIVESPIAIGNMY